MNNALLLRALRGPLTLILVGILFLIDQGGGISFTKTWPVIIIFLGVVRLAERGLAPPQEPPPPTPPAFPPNFPPTSPQGGAQ
ncbi:MAG: hypothetical protein HYX27_16850 [Acidobacteria bacterium]|nr:hypothetical protein [Acidobacteriota bacterium]